MKTTFHFTTIALLAVLIAGFSFAQSERPETGTAPEPSAEEPAAAESAGEGDESAEQVLNELLRRRSENPLIEPARPASPASTSAASPVRGAASPSCEMPALARSCCCPTVFAPP